MAVVGAATLRRDGSERLTIRRRDGTQGTGPLARIFARDNVVRAPLRSYGRPIPPGGFVQPQQHTTNDSAIDCLRVTGAVAFNAVDFFTFTSGATSPIYVDNRQLLGFPAQRRRVGQLLTDLVENEFPNAEVVAGTATAGIPWATIVAERLDVPMCYVRSAAKSWGRQRAVEGYRRPGARAVIVEDLLYSGGSTLTTAERLREEDMTPVGVVSIVTYGLARTASNLAAAQLPWASLSSVPEVVRGSDMSPDEREVVLGWLDQRDDERNDERD